MRVLVTGSEGFIGSHLVTYLRSCHHDVITLDKRMAPRGSEATHIYHELGGGAGFPLDLTEGVTHVVHLVRELSATTNLLDAIAKNKSVEQVLILSMDTVATGIPGFHEEYRYSPTDLRGATAAAIELVAKGFIEERGVPVVIVRSPSVFGINNPKSSLSSICNSLTAGIKVFINNASECVSVVPVSHVCDFLSFCIQASFIPPGSILHIGGAGKFANGYLALLAAQILRVKADLVGFAPDESKQTPTMSVTEETMRYGCPMYDASKFLEDYKEVVLFYKGGFR